MKFLTERDLSQMNITEIQDTLVEFENFRAEVAKKTPEEKAQLRDGLELFLSSVEDAETRKSLLAVLDDVLPRA
jgi:hypothetical protein